MTGVRFAVRTDTYEEFLEDYFGVICSVCPSPVMPGWVYLFGELGGPVKIGYAANVNARVSTLRTASPDGELLATFAGSREVEGFLHTMLWPSRVRGEWFSGMDVEDMVTLVWEIQEMDDADHALDAD